MSEFDALSIQATVAESGHMPYGLQDIEQLRLLLNGDSVVEWRQLAFTDMDSVDGFLMLLGLDWSNERDRSRALDVHRRALNYLRSCLSIDVCEAVANPTDLRQLFLYASRPGSLEQAGACILLKVMHVAYHVAGRELLYKLAVPINELFHRIETRVFDTIDGMRGTGIRISEFAGSRKSYESIYTKLLSRRGSVASQVHDRLRFRIITETLEDLFSAVVYLTRHLIPFSYVVPGESTNDLIDLAATLRGDPNLSGVAAALQRLPTGTLDDPHSANAFSASGFRVLNFVADIPVRVDDVIEAAGTDELDGGHIVLLYVEFQLVDRATAEANNSGENRHALYKARQRTQVSNRLKGT